MHKKYSLICSEYPGLTWGYVPLIWEEAVTMLYSTTPGFGDSQRVCIRFSKTNYKLVLSLLRPCACGLSHIPQHQDLLGHEKAQVCLHFWFDKFSNPIFILLLEKWLELLKQCSEKDLMKKIQKFFTLYFSVRIYK